METTFTELRNKQVINVLNGKLIGNICDMVIDLRRNCIKGFLVPKNKGFWSIFSSKDEIFIPFENICKIGEDVILVEYIEKTSKRREAVKVFDAGTGDEVYEPKYEPKEDNKKNQK
jgi:YlmC/YmxH family sporulation protein